MKLKPNQILLGVMGVAGLGVGALVLLKNKSTAEVMQSGGSGTSASDYSGSAYSDWSSQQKAPVTNVEPIGIFKTAVESTMTFFSNITNPRGIRNNNPLNIRWNAINVWEGLANPAKDSAGFCIFLTPEHGIRAAAKVLDSYAKRGVTTIQKIIETWAPAADNNNVKAYVDHVCQKMGKTPNSVITRADYVPLLSVMILHENGKQPYTVAQIQKGVSMP